MTRGGVNWRRERMYSHKFAHDMAGDRLTPVRMDRQHASLVAAAFRAARLDEDELDDTALWDLPAFADKLEAAAERRRVTDRHDGSIAVYLTRSEALAGFHYVVLFSHPDVPEASFTTAERQAALASPERHRVLVAARGVKRLDCAQVERRLESWDPATSAGDPRWILLRLKKRVAEEAVRARPETGGGRSQACVQTLVIRPLYTSAWRAFLSVCYADDADTAASAN